MKNKGFTLIEIIGAIIIIGIIGVIATVVFTNNLRGFREDYYTETIRSLTESGKEFFNDNRKYRPSEVLQGQVVPVSTLITQKYTGDVLDYKGNKCSNNSYVIVIKNGQDDYIYHTCLVCSQDDYSNMSDKYCDPAWTNSTTIEYDIAEPPELYVIKGTPRSSLREELGIKVSFIKRNAHGEVIGVVDGTGFDEVPVVYPENIDTVDTNTLGRYPLKYVYRDKTTEGHVTVYQLDAPTITIKEQETYAINLSGRTRTDSKKEYVSGDWAQVIFVTGSPGGVSAGGVDLSTARIRNVVNRYQWNKDGAWQDFYPGSSFKDKKEATEMNESIKFRTIDVNGRVSEETDATIIRIDNTKPVCNIVSDGEVKTNPDWYTSNVTISFSKNEDLVRTSPEAVSGVKTSNITISTGTLDRLRNEASFIHDFDTKGSKYIGYVEDRAGNFILCDTSFKRDATDPKCELKTAGKRETTENEWYFSAYVVISFKTKSDLDDKGKTTNSSGIKVTKISGDGFEHPTSITDPNDTDWVTYTGYIEDNAGNTVTCTTKYKKDSTKPTCTVDTEGPHKGNPDWYTGNVTISFTEASDNLSGIRSHGIGSYEGNGEPVIHKTDTKGITYTGYIVDNAGNKNSCKTSFKLDATPPTCELKTTGTKETGNEWYKSSSVVISFKIKNDLDDNGVTTNSSGVKVTKITGDGFEHKTSITDPNDTPGVTYNGYIEDVAGNSSTCDISYKKDSTKPECSITSSGPDKGTDWYTGTVTISFTSATDNLSGVRSHGIGTYEGNGESKEHTKDTKNVTYTGYISDNAGNKNNCKTSFKKDETLPKCSLQTTGTYGDNKWYITAVGISFKNTTDATSGVESYALNSIDSGTQETVDSDDTTSKTYTGYVRDNAYNVGNCTITYKKDETPPECELKQSGTMGDDNWYTSNVVVSFQTKTDATSGIKSYGIGSLTGNASVTHKPNTTGVTYTGYIKDKAGNTNDCSTDFKKDDASDAGGCYSSLGNDNWTKITPVNYAATLANKPISGCKASSTSGVNGSFSADCTFSNTYFSPSRETFSPGTFYFTSGSGVLIPCNVTHNIYLDIDPPTCGNVSYSSDSTSGVNATIVCQDTGGSDCKKETYSSGTTTSSGSVTIADNAKNQNTCSYTVSSYKEHAERTWDSCKTGDPDECVKHGWCDKTVDFDGSSADCYSKQGTINQFNKTCVVTYWCCKKHENTCKGGWNDWSGYYSGPCTQSNTSKYECDERTMYHGG